MTFLRRPLQARQRSRPRSGQIGRPAGVSFVEMLIVMVIFGILVSFSAPRIQSLRGANGVRSAQQAVSSLTQRVRAETRLRKQHGFLHVSADSIWVRIRNPDGSLQRIANPLRLQEQFGVATAVSPTLDSVRYDVRGIGRTYHRTDGVPGEGGTVTLRFTASGKTDSLCISGLGLIAACGL